MVDRQNAIQQINGRFLTAPNSFILKQRGAWQSVSANHLDVTKGEEFTSCVDALAIAIHFGSPVALDWQWGDDTAHLGTPVWQGSCHIQPGGVPHWSRWFDDNAGDMLVILLEQSFLKQVMQDDINQQHLAGQFGVRDRVLEGFGHLFQAEVDTGAEGSQLYIDSLATALLLHLYRNYTHEAKALQSPKGGLSRLTIKTILEYIDQNIDQNLSLIDLASVAQMSASHFSRLFKQSIGQSPHQYLNQCRIEKAKKLLTQPSASISDISQQLGFSDQSQFTNLFKKSVGITPKHYRSEQLS